MAITPALSRECQLYTNNVLSLATVLNEYLVDMLLDKKRANGLWKLQKATASSCMRMRPMLCRSCADSGSKRKPKNDTNQSGIPTQQEERPPKQTLLFVFLVLFVSLQLTCRCCSGAGWSPSSFHCKPCRYRF